MTLQRRPLPEPGAGQVRVRTVLAGICGSDVHIFHGHHPTAKAPVVQGHEFVGVIDAVGAGVDAAVLRVGSRCVVEPLISCGTCEACRRGLVHVCRRLRLLGIHADGAFAGHFIADAAKVIEVPDDVPDEIAALTEPFAVGVHVCSRAGLEPGSRVLVVGAGPIGLVVAMVAATCGATVAIAEINASRRELAASFGFATIDPAADAAAATAAFTASDGFDACFEVSGAAGGLSTALDATRVRGTVVQVGFFSKPPTVELMKLILKELSLVGSRVYRFEDFRRTVGMLRGLHRDGRFELSRLISQRVGLSGVQSAIAGMEAGAITGKVLVRPAD
jgi:2-desacetyl-2-hydroxyethyl bacteriochlorophyllide A dehydrogenase